MVFSSHLFVYYFLPLALLVYYVLPPRARLAGLAALSYLFYGWTNPAFCLLMLASTSIDYVCGRVLEGHPPASEGTARIRKLAVTASIVANLSLLGFFKYYDLATSTWDALATAFGLSSLTLESTLRVTLPLGISFYTFQSMSYTIDVYRGRSKALRDPIAFAAYVSMFPQLVAGPILRYSEIADQLSDPGPSRAKATRGVTFFSLGLAKKVLLANPCGEIADATFGAASVGLVDAWYGASAYAFQIYFDFSGYSDMAIGLGLLLGFVFPKNFDSPYLATSATDFWRRWHISLSTWLRDYLYVPLGGNRRGALRTYLNLALVMLLGGLWHGAAWTFLAWGAIHGLWLAAERARGKRGLFDFLPTWGQNVATFVVLLFTWVLFRADDFGHATRYFASMVGLTEPSVASDLLAGWIYRPYFLLVVLTATVVTWSAPQTWDWSRSLGPSKVAATLLLLVTALGVMAGQDFNPFIYFIF